MRVVSWNIRGALGMDGRRSIDRIAEDLEGMDADVVCLQEVHRNLPGGAEEHQDSRLAEILGMNAYFSSAMRFGRRFGNAVLTRWPMGRTGSIDLHNRHERRRPGLFWERRILQVTEVPFEGGVVQLLNTHWSLHPADRLKAAEITAQLVSSEAMPVVLCGDLNAPPDAPEVTVLRESGLTDAGAASDLPTFPAVAPRARIDFVWAKGMRVTAFACPEIESSDHRPVVVDLLHETDGA